jgi:hypothetical protein
VIVLGTTAQRAKTLIHTALNNDRVLALASRVPMASIVRREDRLVLRHGVRGYGDRSFKPGRGIATRTASSNITMTKNTESTTCHRLDVRGS